MQLYTIVTLVYDVRECLRTSMRINEYEIGRNTYFRAIKAHSLLDIFAK